MDTRIRTNVYVDGFNWQNSLFRSGPFADLYWLDIQKFFVKLRNEEEVLKIFYATPPVVGPGADSYDAYIRVLMKLKKMKVEMGYITNKSYEINGKKLTVPMEKATDVMIAVEMMQDAFSNSCDLMVLVSSDSDFAPILPGIKKANKDIHTFVYTLDFRENSRSGDILKGLADKSKLLPTDLFRHCQLPDPARAIEDEIISKPPPWWIART